MSSQLENSLNHVREGNAFSLKRWVLTKVLIYVNGKLGTLVQSAIGAGLAWLAVQLLRLGFDVPESLWHEIEHTAMGIGAFLVMAVTQWMQAHWNLQVTEALGSEPRVWIGKQTVKRAQAVNEIMSAAQQP